MRIADCSAGFQLPLTPEQFEHALKRGLGRALLHAREFGLVGVEQLLSTACRECWVFDPQCEGTREDWLIEIGEAAGQLDLMRDAVLRGFSESPPQHVYYTREQHCQLASRLIQRGHDLREPLYEAFAKRDGSEDLVGAEAIIECDGADGLLYVATRFGTWLQSGERTTASDWPVFTYNERHGEGSAQRILARAAQTSNAVGVYWKALNGGPKESKGYVDLKQMAHKLPTTSPKRRPTDSTLDELIELVNDETAKIASSGFGGWGKKASLEDRTALQEHIFGARTPKTLARFLGAFMRTGLPAFDARIIDLIDHPDDDIARRARDILDHHRHPDVRRLALERSRQNTRMISLLQSNWEPGDENWIRQIELPQDECDFHWTLSDLLEVVGANPAGQWLEVLLFCYEQTPCVNCRWDAVRTMRDRNELPAWVAQECLADGDEHIRTKATTDAA